MKHIGESKGWHFHAWRSFRSRAALGGAGIYLLAALGLVYLGFFTPNDGGPFIFMSFIYYPASRVTETILWHLPLAIDVLDPQPILAAMGCLLLGTAWYYYLLKTLAFVYEMVLRGLEKKLSSVSTSIEIIQTWGPRFRLFQSWRSFRSRTAMVGAGIYLLLALRLSYAGLFKSNDGFPFVVMSTIYYPVSRIVEAILVYLIQAFNVTFQKTLLLTLACLFVGTAWYYYLLKTLAFICVKGLGQPRETHP